MSFLFVDRITHLEEGRCVRGIKQVTLSDGYLCPSLKKTGAWMLMPSIIGETLGQLGAWCAMQANGFTLRPVAGVVLAVHIHGEARVGDMLCLETIIDALDETAVEYHSVATVNSQPVFTIESALGPMLPMAEFIDPVLVRQQFHQIYRPSEYPWEYIRDAQYVSAMLVENAFEYQPIHVDFDTILECQLGKFITAQKQVSLSAPYFSDHFPHKPVLPLTLLLQAKLALAARFLAQSFDDGCDFKPVTVRKIKMSDFVQPGDCVVTHLQLKEKTADHAIIQYRTELHGKRVCMAEAVFKKQEKVHDDE